MTDRELLEMAAKAAGLRLEWDWDPAQWVPMFYEGKTYHEWNPLVDDGDALRLAVKLRLTVCTDGTASVSAAEAWKESTGVFVTQWVSECSDKQEATRRAIVRAAAEIGKAM